MARGPYVVRPHHILKTFEVAERKAVALGYEATGITVNLRSGDVTLAISRPAPAPAVLAPAARNCSNNFVTTNK
jgi:hypothetical protein